MAEVNSEVQDNLENENTTEEVDFETMLEESFKTQEDALINGVIIDIKDDIVLIDVGKKSEGGLNISEIQDFNGNIKYKVGDEIKVIITGYRNERPIVSHKKAIKKEKIQNFIDNFNPENENIHEVKFISKNRGGFIVENEDEVEFFIPRSHALVRNPNSIVGRKVKVKILKIDKETNSIVASRKKLLEEDRRKRKELVQAIIEHEDVIQGVIKKITTYGMFVDVGGVDGLVHYSEISYKGPVNPEKIFSEGDKVAVKVINYDKEKKHLSLSIKEAMPDPWVEIKDVIEVGDAIKVIVSNIEPYGAFVDLGNDVEGFLHISELSWDKNVKHPKEYIEENQELDVEVIEVDYEQRRLRVSLKNLLPKPFDEFSKKYNQNDIVKGEITTLTDFGAFIKIDGIEGLLHNEDVSWKRNDKCKKLLKIGEEIEVKIIKIDKENEKISLSKKDLSPSPIQEFIANHKNDDIVKGKIRDIKEFGIFVDLGEGVDALIRVEDLGTNELENFKKGDDIEAAIAFLDERRNRIRLSLRRLSKIKEREVLKAINNDDDKMTLGDILKDQLN